MFSGLIAETIGRSNATIIGSLFLYFFQSMISISYDYASLCVLRFFTTFLIGIFAPLAITLLTEIIPSYTRGKFIVYLGLAFIVG